MNKEFQELSEELDGILNRKVNGQLLFGGKSADFTDGLLDENSTGATPQKISIDVGTTKGKMITNLVLEWHLIKYGCSKVICLLS